MTRRHRIPVALLGATGLVGQHLVRLLDVHPYFRVAELFASARRSGVPYADSVRWMLGGAVPRGAGGIPLRSIESLEDGGPESPIVLSALPGSVAAGLEPELARRGRIVCTNASAHRLRGDVPLIIPEINHDLVPRGCVDQGGIVANPNCVVTGLALALAPLDARWGLQSVTVVTLQALSGAGLSGPGAIESLGNVIPYIAGEEEKIGPELNKILGSDVTVATAVNRVPVHDGHLAHVFASFERRPPVREARAAMRDFRVKPDLALPTLPERPLELVEAPDRPQPRLDAGAGAGMRVTVGGVREAPPHDLAMTVVSHNAIRGAAGACLANAELWASRHGLAA